MKKLYLLSILLCILQEICGYTYSNQYNTQPIYTTTQTVDNTYMNQQYTSSYKSQSIVGYSSSRIGYSTQDYGRINTYNMYSNQYSNYYSTHRGTYTPISGYTPGPKRITVYDSNGNTRETPGGDSDPEGIYQYDESTGIWYYSPDNGLTWYEYRQASGFWERFIGLFGGGWGEQWRSVNHQQTENTTNFASDPDDPFLQPIGDLSIFEAFLLICVFGGIYLRFKLWRE